MKLVSSVRRAESAMAAAKKRGAMRPRAQGIVWGPPVDRIDPETVAPGQSIATDVVILGAIGGGYGETGVWVRPTLQLAQTERLAAGSDDRGRVTHNGREVGLVVEVVGHVISIEYFAGMDPGAPPRCVHCGREVGADPAGHECGKGVG